MIEKHLLPGLQEFCKEIGEAACYALCLLDVAYEYNAENNPVLNKDFDPVKILYECCSGTGSDAIIYYNEKDLNDNNNFYVQYPAELLRYATKRSWKVEKCYNVDYECTKNQYEIKYYERIKTGGVTGHFERDLFKPYKNSQTVKYGKLHTLRICTVLK